MSNLGDHRRTRFCVLTASGRSAIAVVAVAGPATVELVDRHFRAVNGRSLARQPISRIVYGHWGGESGEDLVVCRRAEQEVEIHCHGGTQSVARIAEALTAADCEQVDWAEWLAGRASCPLAAEAQVALATTTTLRTATVLLAQYHGALRRELETIGELLNEGAADLATGRVEQLLGRAEFGLHLTQPWRVVIVGLPNVGKSSLTNALVGFQRAIVYDQPGTTRDVVSATTALNGWPVQFVDTAGLQATDDVVESSGIALARDQLRNADLAVWLLDATILGSSPGTDASDLVTAQAESVAAPCGETQTLVAINKCDLAMPPVELGGDFHTLSATTGAGIQGLIDAMAQRLVPEVPPTDTAVPFTDRQVELLRALLASCQAAEIATAKATVQRLLSSG